MREDLKTELIKNGITRREAADALGLHYFTFCNKLNLFSRFTPEEERKLVDMIKEKESVN